jgi:septal ring factor EnvC (AmiA/AmiB activator)
MRKIAFACLLVLFLTGSLLPETGSKDKLSTINKEIAQINAKLGNLKKDEKSILNDIYRIELNYEKAVIENNKLKMQLRNMQEKINKKSSEKRQLENEIALSKKNLKKILRILYKLGGNSYLKLFIRVDSLDQLFKNYRMFTALIGFKSEELEKLKTNVMRLNQVRQELQTSHDNLRALQRQKEQKIRNIRGHKRSKLNLVNKINNDRKKYLQLLDELRNEAARLNELISGKEVRRPMKTLDLEQIRGRLIWPLDGRVVSSFGKKRSTRFNTYIINNGIKIKPSGSADVRAVYNGTVVFANYFKGYGNLVIIQHGKNLYSLYGHCEKIFKEKGDNVREGELISVAGDSGSTSGKVLYFEIRTQSTAQDPLRWLQKRGRRG